MSQEDIVKEWYESDVIRESYQDKYGDDWWWKLNEVHDRMLEKLGICCEDCISEQPEHEITVGDYTTKYFFMCGSAQKTMKKYADKEGAEELTKMQDAFYKMEKEAMDSGSASDEQKEQAQDLYDKIIAKSKEVGIADEVDRYMKMHLNSMLKGKPKLGFGRTDVEKPKSETVSFTNFRKLNKWDEISEGAEYNGRPVKLNNPTKGDIKKYKVYVKNDKGNVVKVEFGDPKMEIKRDDPARRKSFRARHNCDNPGPKWKARYWSCKFWSAKSVSDLMKG